MQFGKFSVLMGTLVLALCGRALAASEVMTLKSQNGTALTARILNCDGTTLTLSRESDQKTFTLPLARLDAASQEAVKSWMTQGGNLVEKFEISVDTGKSRRTTGQEDFDDKRVNLDPFITLRNANPNLGTRAAKVTVLFLGRPVSDGSAIHVFKKSTFDLPSLPALGSQSFRVGTISSAYDDRGYAQFGARYLGYVVMVHDAEGKTLYDSTSVPAPLVATHGLAFLTLSEQATYDRELRLATR